MTLDARQRAALQDLSLRELRFDEPLREHSPLRIGGPADGWAVVDTLPSLEALRRCCRRGRVRLQAAPLGHDQVVRSAGIRGVVVIAAPEAPPEVQTAVDALGGCGRRDGEVGQVLEDPEMGPPASRLAEEAGLGGIRLRGARISEHDANIVENDGGASARDVLALAAWMQERIQARTGLQLTLRLRAVGAAEEPPRRGPVHPST